MSFGELKNFAAEHNGRWGRVWDEPKDHDVLAVRHGCSGGVGDLGRPKGII